MSEEVRHHDKEPLEDRLHALEERVEALESNQGKEALQPQSFGAPMREIPKPLPYTPHPDDLVLVTPSQLSEEEAESNVHAAPSEAPKEEVSTFEFLKGKARAATGDREDVEFQVGGKAFTGIGAVAILLGVGFFLQYAFENELISETMRVVLGFVGGIGLLAFGQYAQKRFGTYGQIVTGAGLGVMYLSTYGAAVAYEIMPLGVAFFTIVIITVAGIFLALRNDAQPLLLFALIGGMLTPQMIATFRDNPHTLFPYLIVLNIALLVIAYYKLWRPVAALTLVGTAISYLSWHVTHFTQADITLAMTYASALFLIHFAVTYMHFLFRDAEQESADLLYATAIAILYFGAGWLTLHTFQVDALALFSVVVGILHVLATVFAKERDERSARYRQILVAIASLAFVLAAYYQFDSYGMTVAWAMEGLVLTYLAFSMRSRGILALAQMIFIFALLRIGLLDHELAVDAIAFFNTRALTSLLTFGALVASTGIIYLRRDELPDAEESTFSLFLIESALLLLWLSSLEFNDAFGIEWIPIAWMVVAAMLMSAGLALRSYPARMFALFIGGASVFYLILVTGGEDMPRTIFNWRGFAFLEAGFVLIYMYALMSISSVEEEEQQTATSGMLLGCYALAIWWASIEIFDFFNHSWLPVVWTLLGLGAILLALRLKSTALRLAVYATFLVTAFRLFMYESDLVLTETLPILNSRVGTYLFFAVALLTIIWLVRHRDNGAVLEDERKVITYGGLLLMNAALLWAVSLEVFDYYDRLVALGETANSVNHSNAKNASLSVAWTFYSIAALITGVVRRSSFARILSIALFGVVIIKVFLYDSASLDSFWRFVSFIILGIILLLAGYLYNRFKDRITSFIQVQEEEGVTT